MAEFILVTLTGEDRRRAAEIIAAVPGVTSLEEAISWALQNTQVPSEYQAFIPLPPMSPAPDKSRIIDLAAGEHRSIDINPGTHRTDIYKISVGELSNVLGSVLVDRHALQQLEPNSRLGLLSTAELMKLE